MKQIDLLKDYITQKQQEAADGKVENTANSHGLVNGTIETNLGLFRAYMTMYLLKHPWVNKELTLMVRTLEPTQRASLADLLFLGKQGLGEL